MLIVMDKEASQEAIDRTVKAVESMGFHGRVIPGAGRVAIGVVGNQGYVEDTAISRLPGVSHVIHVTKPYKLVSRDFHPQDTIVTVDDLQVGEGYDPVIIAGPCSVESEEQMFATAEQVKRSGAHMLRGGAFKPRTGPHNFQGLGEAGLRLLSEAGKSNGLPVVTEVMRIGQLELVARYADVLQIGARNMQNFDLLKEVGKIDKPVLLKRGMCATLDEFLAAAEYILVGGNPRVILCERGIRTFETATRNTMDLAIVPLVKEKSHLPIIVDPSHATGKSSLVAPMTVAGLVVGAHGVMVEVHPQPECALSDGLQSLDFVTFDRLMQRVKHCLPKVE
ncbi:MAG: 3-deoxy-7-phosphoheptulonate synthase [Deltaproteobacteria bacterium]|nr:3-deoxy-7-phosphoheptulonate synthase [Candidatus Anaeroferrophillus wilburensis]MBN2889855.1 3-deoxy-7-phosphoheptulonate synthase [Deltaproteobacteria bacterium]